MYVENGQLIFPTRTIYILHETVTCHDRDPLWINSKVRQLIQEENDTHRSYILNYKNPQIFHKVKNLQKQLKHLIERSQEKYYSRISKKIAVTFACDNILTLNKNLDPNKAHEHDMISIRMLKLCSKSTCKPLDLIFQSFMKQGKFLLNGKKQMLFLSIKRKVSRFLLTICRKFLERLIYNNLF